MAKKRSTTTCSGCLEDIKSNELYIVNRLMRSSDPALGFYRTFYCKECIKDQTKYHSIFAEPKKK